MEIIKELVTTFLGDRLINILKAGTNKIADEVCHFANNKILEYLSIEGDVIFDLGKYKGLRILQKEMVFIPQSIETRIKSMTGSKCILLFWDRNVSVCDKLFLGSLPVRDEERTADNFILPIRKPLVKVLDSVGAYLEAKLLCKHMHLLKQQELLLVLKGFYTKKELAAFFSTSTGIRRHFEKFVIENYKKVSSVKEFADLYYVSERSFSRKFHSCFGESPYKWMQKKKAEQMLEMVCDLELSFQEISSKLGFSSPSHFTAYCRRMYGMSPTQLREKNKK